MNVNENELRHKQYGEKYGGASFYWTIKPSRMCFEVLKQMPRDRLLKLLDIACGEGRNAFSFARNGYAVHALDVSQKGIERQNGLLRQYEFACTFPEGI